MMTRMFPLLLLILAWPAAALAQDDPAAPWYERLRFGGDFRSRYEGFYEEDVPARNRVRLRLRLRLDAEINDDTALHLQVASGDPGTPVSTNQTFTGFFTPKPFSLDRAFLVYTPGAGPLTLGMGKFPRPMTSTQMTFDEDLSYEGGWEQLSWGAAGDVEATLVALQTAVNERSAGADSYMLAGYGALAVPIGAHRLQLSAASYAWGHPDQIAIGSDDGALESILTNTLVRDAAGNVIGYASPFNVVDIIAEATFTTARAEYPVRLLADLARNTRAATGRDSGLWIEAQYGRARAAGTWMAAYTYGWIEQDVTPSAFVFSDMPGTNQRLHMIETSYTPKSGLNLDTTLHFTQPLVLDPGAPRRWRTRLHLAAVVRF